MQAVYRQDTRQATLVLTITDTTPAIIAAILADPRIDHDTAATRPPRAEPVTPATSENTSVDVSHTAIRPETLRDRETTRTSDEGIVPQRAVSTSMETMSGPVPATADSAARRNSAPRTAVSEHTNGAM